MLPLKNQNKSYQRLEFLGDRVLNLIVSFYLYKKFPDDTEGELTNKLRFTSNENLEEITGSLPEEFRTELFRFRDTLRPDGQTSNADAIEAFIGSYFLEHGLEAATGFVEKNFAEHIDRFDPDTDYISNLKVHFEKEKKPQPVYQLERTEPGPNNQEIFHIQVFVGGVLLGSGSGSSHERAKKSAAHEALKRL